MSNRKNLEDPVFIGKALYGVNDGVITKTSKFQGVYVKGQELQLQTLNSVYTTTFSGCDIKTFFVEQLRARGFKLASENRGN